MSTPGQLVDPRLAAFWASDPGVLPTPDPLHPEASLPAPDGHHARLALELAAAFLICATLVRNQLARRGAGGDPEKAASDAWGSIAPVWLNLAGAAIRKSLGQGELSGSVNALVLDSIADQYATGLSNYLGATSAKAFNDGVDRQLAGRWSEKASWVRAASGFGLDRQGYNAFLTNAAVESTELITPAAQALADAALLARAELIGDSEAFSAGETAKAMTWRQLQDDGELPDTARRMWRTAVEEDQCPICGPLNHKKARLDRPFTTSDKQKLWAPQAHPNCRCRIELIGPVIKAFNPREKRDGQGQWTRSTTYKEPVTDPIADAVWAEAHAPVDEEQDKASIFETPVAPSVFEQSDVWTKAQASSVFARPATGSVFGKPQGAGVFATPVAGVFSRPPGSRKRHIITRHTTFILPPPQPLPDPNAHAYYLPVDEFHVLTDDHPLGSQYSLTGESFVDFDNAKGKTLAATHLTAMHHTTPWTALPDDYAFYDRVNVATSRDQVADAWKAVIFSAKEVWDDSMDNVEVIAGHLSSRELQQIYSMAGDVDLADQAHSADEYRSEIISAVRNPSQDDEGLAAAYADWVTWLHPEKAGANGVELAKKFEEQGMNGYYIGGQDPSDITDQVFVFADGFHLGTRQDDEVAHPEGKFVMTGHRYRSALADFRAGDVPPMRFGLIEAYMQPFVVRDRGHGAT